MPLLTELEVGLPGILQTCRAYGAAVMAPHIVARQGFTPYVSAIPRSGRRVISGGCPRASLRSALGYILMAFQAILRGGVAAMIRPEEFCRAPGFRMGKNSLLSSSQFMLFLAPFL
jgi:hypothetical protein